MAYGDSGGSRKLNWMGECDGTPPSKPETNARNAGEVSKPRGDAWKGMGDGTPSSKPTKPANS